MRSWNALGEARVEDRLAVLGGEGGAPHFTAGQEWVTRNIRTVDIDMLVWLMCIDYIYTVVHDCIIDVWME